jgi:hypothetical protein
MKKFFLVVGAIVAVLAFLFSIGFTVFLNMLPHDIAPIDDSDLYLSEESIAENAFTNYVAAGEALCYPSHGVRQYTNDMDPDIIGPIMASNAQCFAYVKLGNSRKRCLAPVVKSYSALLPYIHDFLSIARLMSLKTKFEASRGQLSEAIETVTDLMRFAYLYEDGPGCTLDYLVAVAMRGMALKDTRRLVLNDKLDSTQLVSLKKMLMDCPPSKNGVVWTWKAEYMMFSSLVESIASGNMDMQDFIDDEDKPEIMQKLSIKYFFHPNRTKSNAAVIYRELIAQSTNFYVNLNLTDPSIFLEDVRRDIKNAALLDKPKVANPLGAFMCSMMLMPARGVLEKKYYYQASYEATVLITALHIFKSRTGHYPATLNELVPDIIPAVPLDPYDGKPMRYDESRGIIYSVGKDLVDSGGSRKSRSEEIDTYKETRPWKTKDIVFDAFKTNRISPIN